MRLFLAIPMPHDVSVMLAGLQRGLKGGRPVEADAFHLTLTFCGRNVSNEVAEELHETLEAGRFRRPVLRVAGIGHFGHAAPRALWARIEGDEALNVLQAKVETAARRAGCEVPKRRFVPHVTLARYSEDDPVAFEDAQHLMTRHGSLASEPFSPNAFHLYQSHLGRSGPDYEVLADYPLV